MESVQLEHENVTQLVLVSLRDGVEEGRRLSNEEKDPFERIERGAACTVL
jgi:small subunit ribosomal protein S12